MKELCRNIPSHFKHRGSLLVIITWNLCSASRHVNTPYIDYTFPKNHSLSALFTIQSKTKCFSSSISLHIRHFLLATGVLGLVCRPLSISNKCELHRNFAIEWRYCDFLTWYRYGSIDYSYFIVVCVLKIGLDWISCRFANQVAI